MADCTVIVLAYNLENYILDCLNSIEEQETIHNIKVLVHEDCSTDETLSLINEFASKSKLHFDIVVPKENRYKKGMGFFYDLLLDVDTKYVAILDGDDVWTDKSKLQIQIDQLESNPNLAISSHVFSIVTTDLQTELGTWPNCEYRNPIGRSSELSKENFIGALTAVFRRSFLPEAVQGYNALGTNDYPIWGLLSSRGDIGFIDKNMAKYRQHGSQMYANRSDESRRRIALECKIFIANSLERGELRDVWIDSICSDVLGSNQVLVDQMEIDNLNLKTELARSREELARSRDLNDYFFDESESLKHQIELFDLELKVKSNAIESVYRSFSWRITRPVRRLASIFNKIFSR